MSESDDTYVPVLVPEPLVPAVEAYLHDLETEDAINADPVLDRDLS